MNGDPKDILGIRSGIPTKPGLEEPVTFDELFDLHDESDKEPRVHEHVIGGDNCI